MNRKIFFILLISMAFSISVCYAHRQAVIVPLNVKKNLQNVITVAKSGGDFKSPAAAMASIADASIDNRYLIFIGPGEYTLSAPLEIKQGVSLIGSGPLLTILTGAVASEYNDERSALLEFHGLTRIQGMYIENTGVGDYSFGISSNTNDLYTAYIDDVHIRVKGGSVTKGVSITGVDGTIISNSRISALGAGYSYGVYLKDRLLTLENSNVYGGSGANTRGIYSNNATLTIRNSQISGKFGTTSNYGIYSISSRDTKVYQSIVEGSHFLTGSTERSLITTGTGTNHVIRSTMIGAVTSSGTFSCTYSDDGEGGILDATCN